MAIKPRDRFEVEALIREQTESSPRSLDTPYAMPATGGNIFGCNHFINVWGWDTDKSAAVAKFFGSGFKDRKVVDLGAGLLGSVFYDQAFSALAGAKEYTAVDLFCEDYKYDKRILVRNTRDINEVLVPHMVENYPELVSIVSKNLESSCLNEDMLRYLCKQDKGSNNVIMNGVDYAIVDNKDYIDELRNQIARVVPVGGYAVGFNSPHLMGLENLGFERIREIPGYGVLSNREGESEVANRAELAYRRKK